jgi:drug/metabolite transporter (DMT)-like permease
MNNIPSKQTQGIRAALSSAFFLGLAPIFGKQAILVGLSPMAVVALRTVFATILLLVVMFVYRKKYFYIYPAGLLGCFLAGGINGLGSLFYYDALGRIDASLGHLLYLLYPLFVALWMWLDRQPPSHLTVFRLLLALPALFLLTQAGSQPINWIGIGEMLVAAAFYALHLPINQRVLYDMPAPTVTLYTLIAMSLVVLPAQWLSGSSILAPWQGNISTVPILAWGAILGLTLMTFLSRLTLFMGVKHLGGMQTALLGLGEILVTVSFAYVWLGERFSPMQWAGAVLLVFNLGLVALEKSPTRQRQGGGWLKWLHPSRLPADLPWQPHE